VSFSINTVTISGNLTRQPELRATASGTSVCNLGIACNDRYKDAGGEWKDKPYFFDVVVWGAVGEAAARDLNKGSKVVLHGKLTQNSWEDKDGNKRSKVEINAADVVYDNRQQTPGHKHDEAGYSQDPDDSGIIDYDGHDIPL
jgi:single-strand DNA-binding protein